jgi:hypothetical protein
MIAPLSMSYWEMVRQLAEPFELMKFTLIYDGPLPAGKNKRALYAAKIRNKLHPQMRDLWDHHIIFRQLARTARTIPNSGAGHWAGREIIWSPANLPDWNDPIPPLREGQTDFCAPIEIDDVGVFLPIVRNSLHLSCAIDILFLRQERPTGIFEDSAGDLDNRIKCFFDGLTIPNTEQAKAGEDPRAEPLCCLLENDKLISDFSIKTGRLLGMDDPHKYDVRIQAEITIKVLRVFNANECLLGGRLMIRQKWKRWLSEGLREAFELGPPKASAPRPLERSLQRTSRPPRPVREPKLRVRGI